MQQSHTTHHDSALLYADLDLGFDVEPGEPGEYGDMDFITTMNMLSEHSAREPDTVEDPVPFDFEPQIKVEDDDCLSPAYSIHDDMEVASSPDVPVQNSNEGSSILDQLSAGNNAVKQQGPVSSFWSYPQHVTHVHNPMMPMTHYVAAPMPQAAFYPNMGVVAYPMATPMSYAYVENPYVTHIMPLPQHPYMITPMRPPIMQPIVPPKQEKPTRKSEENERELLEMDDEEFQTYVSKFCSCDAETFEELNSRRSKVIDELKSLEQELQRTRDETIRQYEQLLGNSFDEQTNVDKLNVVRDKVESSMQEVRKHAEAKLRQMVATAHRKKQNRKLPDRATNVLQQWFLDNAKYPYPNVEEKARLQKETQLTLTQINNWFINKRGRALKPIREKIVQQEVTSKK